VGDRALTRWMMSDTPRVESSRVVSGFVVSGEELSAYSSRHFGLVEVTFENWTNERVSPEPLSITRGRTRSPC
jgi:hypothetical protein